MIIYGWTTLQKTLSSHEFHCPQCGSMVYGDLKSANRWFTLYFIPVIPLGSQGEYVECVSCKGTFRSEVLDYEPRRFQGTPTPANRQRMLGNDNPFGAADRDERNPFMAPFGEEGYSESGVKLPPRRLSWAAAGSVVLGILAVVSIFGGILGFLLSVATIIAAHSGYSVNKRAPLRFYGRRLAIAGMILGYGSLAVGAGLSMFDVKPPAAKQNVRKSDEQNSLDTAEALIGGRSGSTFGNTDEARRWAADYAADLEALDKKVFVGNDDRDDVTGRYKTWCELHDDRVAFVVNVPEYRKFSEDVRKVVHLNAWVAAQKVAQKKLKAGDRIAVGLRGSVLYGAVMTGSVGDMPGADMVTTKSATDLLPFFRADAAPRAGLPKPEANVVAPDELPRNAAGPEASAPSATAAPKPRVSPSGSAGSRP